MFCWFQEGTNPGKREISQDSVQYPLEGCKCLVVMLHEEYLPRIFLVFYTRQASILFNAA